MDNNFSEELRAIKSKCISVGISSAEVAFAKDLVMGKNKSGEFFICEVLWAAEKLLQKKIEIEAFFLCEDAIEGNSDATEIEKIAKLLNFSSKNYIISAKSCQKIIKWFFIEFVR